MARSLAALPLLLLLAAAVRAAARARADQKRDLASRLIRTADVHKDRSLRDVLSGRAAAPDTPSQNAAAAAAPAPAPAPAPAQRAAQTKQAEAEVERPRTLSELFAWAIRASASKTAPAPAPAQTAPPRNISAVARTAKKKQPPARVQPRRAGGELRHTARLPAPARHSGRTRTRAARAEAEQLAAGARLSRTEAESVTASILALSDKRASVRERALLLIEELCHSADNGRDVASHGGVARIVRALSAREARVRASAAWALATCAQNNPPVQRKSVELSAVPTLARVAARDQSKTVRARALFALNAVLELDEARESFERDAAAVPAVRRALTSMDTRAVRRALNLAELLVAKNLDGWKTMLEAWDIPPLIERVMRVHHDIDVRESAARVIAALDGRVLA